MSLENVYEDYRADPAFDHLRTEGAVLVPGNGFSRPRVLVVGEAPGATENTTRSPFSGAAGMALRSLIKDVAALEPGDWFGTYLVKYRLAGGRSPVPYETIRSLPYLRREFAALHRPLAIVALGGTVTHAFRPQLPNIRQVAGNSYPLSDGRALFPMLPIELGLRKPEVQPLLESHWERFGTWFREEFK